jgi:alkylhydroperoxidase family enzyme
MIAGRVASAVVQRQVKYVTPVPAAAARGLVARVYAQVAEESRLVVPPALLHSPAPEVLAAYWVLIREPLVGSGRVDRLAKEAVAAAVSVANICPYCVDMHSTGMYELSSEHDAEAIVRDRVEEVTDARIRALARWARTAHLRDDRAPRDPEPFVEAHRAELVGVLVGFHYLTRVVNVFLPSFLLPPRLSPGARRRFKRGVSRVLAPTLRGDRPAGLALPLLPAAELTADASWAVGHPPVAAATARSFAAFEAAGQRSIPAEVRELVLEHLAGWHGEETGLSRDWCERSVDRLRPEDRAAGRLALLTALASYQVDDEAVQEFRLAEPSDRALVETVAWASFAAARRVGRWYVPGMAPPPGEPG